MLLAGFVVEQHLAFDHRLDGFAVQHAFPSYRRRRFQNVVRGASIAVGVNRDLLQQVARRAEFQRLKAAL